ncbi:MAG: zinc-ribbon domain-containing protein [Desulfobacterales bacterium]|jgi:predicted Zn finger-like uncharacterized protein|nr:zinc-ribbon domain-containing protein [Desulfobacterales bacterium]
MIVTCEGCETGFHVDERLLKPAGSKVRCSKCRHVFVAHPPAPSEDLEEPLVLSEEMAPEAHPAGLAGTAAIDAKLDELFDDSAEAADPGLAAPVPEMLDVDDLLLDERSPADGAAAETGELDLNLDLDLDLDADAPGLNGEAGSEPHPAAVAPAAEPELGFDLGLEPSAAAADTAGGLPELEELELDLAELEAADGDAPPPEAKAEVAESTAPELELDLDFDLPLENQKEAAEAGISTAAEEAPAAVPSLDLLNELNLDLAALPEATTTTLAKDAEKKNLLAETDEIDLSDLETILDDAAPPTAVAPAAENPLFGEPPAVEPADASEELDLSFLAETADQPLTVEAEPQTTEPTAAEAPNALATTDELDFSDLSGLLENDRPPAEEVRQIDDVELVLDQPLAAALAAGDPAQESDLEQFLIDSSEESAAADAGLQAAEETRPGASTDLEIEFEPASPAEAEAAAAPATTAVGALPGAVSAAAGAAAGVDSATDVMEAEPEESTAVFKKPQPAAARSSGGLLKALAGAALVLVLALAALVVPRSLGINIPYLTDTAIPILSEIDLDVPLIGNVGKFFKAEAADPAGRLKILPDAASVTAEFVENTAAGRLLVVTGKVRNAYDHPRSGIRVTATLFAKGGSPIRTATVYAGNLLSGQQLATLDTNTILSRLQISTGTANSNVGVKPGASLSFMAVFDKLPAEIDEYSVEAADSKP